MILLYIVAYGVAQKMFAFMIETCYLYTHVVAVQESCYFPPQHINRRQTATDGPGPGTMDRSDRAGPGQRARCFHTKPLPLVDVSCDVYTALPRRIE